MLAAPKHGFIYLAMPKTGSTAVEEALAPHAQMVLKGPPHIKHVRPTRFERELAPFLDASGFPRGGYQTICVVREPVDWLASWWRYRSRPALAERSPDRYTGDMTFSEFAHGVMDGQIRMGRQARFLSGGVDVLFPYEHMDTLLAWVSERVGREVALGTRNVSPPKDPDVDHELRSRLESHYETDFELWRGAVQRWATVS